MIKLILNNLKYTNKETDVIDIATGKYELPKTFRKALKKIKNGKSSNGRVRS